MLPHVHSNFSFMWGANRMGELFAGAARRGWDAVALTDVNNLCGLHEALRAAKDHGVRLAVGAELRAGEGRAAAIAATDEGFANLCRAVKVELGTPALRQTTGEDAMFERVAGIIEERTSSLQQALAGPPRSANGPARSRRATPQTEPGR